MPVTISKKNVLVALSGGVDSSVCVHLLKEQGYSVSAVVFKMSDAHDKTVEDAKEVAQQLGIEIFVADMTKNFEEYVIKYFMNEYAKGSTPNPCIVCNPLVKFNALIKTADEHDIHYVATGHYAKLVEVGENILLGRGDCKKRDQSYMLHRLGQDVLKRLILPLNSMEKTEVRQIAEDLNLPSAKKPDSQEICFIPDNDYASYIEKRMGKFKQGDFISPEGKVCGKHKGIIHYTVGQRKHLGIALGRPVFVKSIDPVENKIYLADAGKDKYKKAVIKDLSFIADIDYGDEFETLVKIRSTAPLAKAKIKLLENQKAIVEFEESLRAVAKGQSIVMYNEDETVVGGGFVIEVEE